MQCPSLKHAPGIAPHGGAGRRAERRERCAVCGAGRPYGAGIPPVGGGDAGVCGEDPVCGDGVTLTLPVTEDNAPRLLPV